MMAPSAIKTAPGNIKTGLRDLDGRFLRSYVACPYLPKLVSGSVNDASLKRGIGVNGVLGPMTILWGGAVKMVGMMVMPQIRNLVRLAAMAVL